MNACTIRHPQTRSAALGDTGRQRWMVREVDAGTTAGGPFYYTAFGERCYYDTGASSWKIGGEFPVGSPRYMYDGGHGYENGFLSLAGANTSLPAITLQHVGERWYESDIGRFLQRDPIGLGGGINVYVYVRNCPEALHDATGTQCEAKFDVWEREFVTLSLEGHSDKALEIAGARAGGVLIGGAILAGGMFLVPQAATAETLVTVTRWGSPIVAGRFVMLGGATWWNYFWSGKWAAECIGGYMPTPFSNNFTQVVQIGSLALPPGWEIWKALLGQRVFLPG